MKTNQAGLDLIRGYEKLELKAYRCPAGVLTIGFGHTGPDVSEGLEINPEQAEELFRADVARFEEAVNRRVCTPLSGNQFSALVSLCFNIGVTAFHNSTLLKLVNKGDPIHAAAEFSRWVHAKGKRLQGLVERREAERRLFLGLA